MLIHKQLPTFDSVQAGRKAVCTIDPGVRVHAITLQVANAAAVANEIDDVIESIAFKLDGRTQRSYGPASRLPKLNSLNGSDYQAKSTGTPGAADYVHYITEWFANPWRFQAVDRVSPAWSLVDSGPLQIEVLFKSGITAPQISGTFQYDAIPQSVLDGGNVPAGSSDSRRIGPIQKIAEENFTASGTQKEIRTLARNLGLYESIHIWPTVGGTSRYVESVKFAIDNQDILEGPVTKEQNSIKLLDWGLEPDLSASPRFDLVFDYTDRIRDALATAQAREIILLANLSGAAAGVLPLSIRRLGFPE